MNFAITYVCNSRCKFCNIWKLKPRNELTLEEIKIFARKAKFFKWVRITGGEPFLRKDYEEIIKVFDENGVYVITTPTNGLTTSLIERKAKNVLSSIRARYVITVSLDGPKDIHDKIRGITGSYERSITTYIRLKKLERFYPNFRVMFGYTISNLNVGKFFQMVESVRRFIPEITYDDFNVNLVHSSEIYYHTKKKTDIAKRMKTEVLKILKKKKPFSSAIDFIEFIYLSLAREYIETKRTPLPCKVYNLSAFVDPVGNVFPCTIFNFKLGNLRDFNYDILRILKSRRALKARKLIKDGKCPHCWTPCEAHQNIVSNFKAWMFKFL
ncbi:MAG: radical SAM protein [Candidatus Aenigmarchaeota archaeon]|nr:radical SAM protein [Candidatus Aenigmarchaeota archaeon]